MRIGLVWRGVEAIRPQLTPRRLRVLVISEDSFGEAVPPGPKLVSSDSGVHLIGGGEEVRVRGRVRLTESRGNCAGTRT